MHISLYGLKELKKESMLGEYKSAIAAYERAYKIEPNPDILISKADALNRLGK